MYVRVYVCGMSVCVYVSIGVFEYVWCICVVVVGVCVFLYVCTVCEGGMCMVCQFVWCVSVCVCMRLEKLTGMIYMKRPNKLNTRSKTPGPIPGCNSSIPVSTYFYVSS